MPEIKNYEGKKKSTTSGTANEKRRPHKEAQVMNAEKAQVAEQNTHPSTEQTSDLMETSDEINTEAQNEGLSAEEIADKDMISDADTADRKREKMHLEFYGSDLIRQKAPKVMDFAETLADEWVQDGRFEGLPVGHPLAQIAVSKVLRKAKDIEKSLEEKGVFAMAKMGAEFLKAEYNKRKRNG